MSICIEIYYFNLWFIEYIPYLSNTGFLTASILVGVISALYNPDTGSTFMEVLIMEQRFDDLSWLLQTKITKGDKNTYKGNLI